MANSVRSDRPPTAVRPMLLSLGMNAKASGSSWVEFGETKVTASVFGPRENQRASGETVNVGILECSVEYGSYCPQVRGRPKEEVEDEQRRASLQLEKALLPAILLDRYPKSVIECNIFIVSGDGSEPAAAVLAGSLALAHAGIEMIDLPVCGTVAGFPAAGGTQHTLLVDPDSKECAAAAFVTRAVLLPALGSVSSAQHEGSVPADTVVQAMALASEAALAVHEEAKRTLLAHASAAASKAGVGQSTESAATVS